MSAQPEDWTLKGFLTHFRDVNRHQPDHTFAWVLGAGASRESGIPTGGELVGRWLAELHERHCADGTSLETWANAANLGIDGFDYAEAASFYSRVFERRYGGYPDEAYAFLESVMSERDPSPGYSILAKIMEDTRHKVVVTTNFDNLVADALSIYTRVFPLVCGHESLTHFVRPQLRRPLVCKIHRDLLLGPQNDPASLQQLNEAWAKTLRTLFSHYTPLVIGYGGNDDTFMGLLEALEPGQMKGRMLWCYQSGRPPGQRIREVVSRHKGAMVAAPSFDWLMVLVGEELGIKPQDQEIELRASARTTAYRKRMEELRTAINPAVPTVAADTATKAVAAALESTLEKAGGWWSWDLKADREPDLEKREQIYREAIRALPRSPELHGNFAYFMYSARRRFDEAESLYRSALELDPLDADNIASFALFVANVRRDVDEAERLFRKALELDPTLTSNIGSLANFLTNVRHDHDEAERLYRKALELDPVDVTTIGNFANFITNVRGNHDEAERLYRKALELDPVNAANIANFANFIRNVRENHDEAERLYRKALELDPAGATNIGNFADFLSHVRRDHDEAEQLYRKALELSPTQVNPSSNFAGFLLERSRWEDADPAIRRAWELTRGQLKQATAEVALYRGLAARARDQSDARALGRLKTLLERGFQRAIWSFDDLLAAMRPKVSDEDFALYSALAAAVLDESKVAELAHFPRWHEVVPLPLDASWD